MDSFVTYEKVCGNIRESNSIGWHTCLRFAIVRGMEIEAVSPSELRDVEDLFY